MHPIRKLALVVPLFGTALTASVSVQAQSVAPDATQIITPQQSTPSQPPPVTSRRARFTIVPRPLTPFPVVKPEPDSPADPSAPVPDDIEPSNDTELQINSFLDNDLSSQVRFNGPSGSGLEPPDASIAVGPNDLIVGTNRVIQIYDKSGNPLNAPISPSTYFKVPPNYNIQSDPKFLYDAQSGRFFGVWIGYDSSTGTGSWFLSVSTSSSASDTYNVYTISESGQLPDYPGLGVCDDKVILTANNFANGPSGPFSGAVAVAVNKAQLIAGNAAFSSIFNNLLLSNGQRAFTVQPAQSLTSTTTCNLVSLSGNSGIQLYQITDTPDELSEAALTIGSVVPLRNAISVPPRAPQRDTTTLIDTGDTRLLGATYRGDNSGSIWTTSTTGCNVSGVNQSCANLVEIQGVDNMARLRRQVIYGSPGLYYYYPALTTDSNNNAAAVFSRSGSTQFAGLRSAICPATAGCSPSLSIVPGTVSYTGRRWGDFFGAALDPSDNATIWLFGEYKGSTSSLWDTFVSTVVPSSNGSFIP